ncbi:hypothetical protein C8F04DRAFT_1252336 [Mycena alexandri]|uniref:Uncharacterized protein n=1 Tax=Mycena alexandri TaxID=1745969 RepID=A0AAD6TEA3_9AGAR|nr:hypothetical protein C8F04DRAFT_1262214 [Mycena alexandri]KAJ7042357.1 hypothetical protein C8F04DRAFT_1252336 [Mycena alexandri]
MLKLKRDFRNMDELVDLWNQWMHRRHPGQPTVVPASTAGKAPASTAGKAPAKAEGAKAGKKTATKKAAAPVADGEKKKRKKGHKESYSSYIYKVLQ